MKYRIHTIAAHVAWVLGIAVGGAAAHTGPEGFVTLSSAGKKVLTRCNPANASNQNHCRVGGLPGESGYTLVASRTSDIMKNEVVIGKLLDRVWKHANGYYIFGAQLRLNAKAYDLTGLSFNANDLFRQVLENKPVSIAYFQSTAKKALHKSGRTRQGLNEVPPEDDDDDDDDVDLAAADAAAEAGRALTGTAGSAQPVRDNAWVDFRFDANAAEVSGVSSAHSPWLLIKTKAPAGYSVQPFALRLLGSSFDDSSEFIEIFLAGHQPN